MGLEEVKKKLEELKKEIDHRIKKVLAKGKNPKYIYDSMVYHLDVGGKRFRPAMVLLANKALGGDTNEALYPAAAIELLHEFSLIHDDLMDSDETRRGKETVWKKYGVPKAILSGDLMYSYSYQALIDSFSEGFGLNLEVFRTFNDTIIYINEGQALDLEFEDRDDVEVNEYLDMVWKKTGALIAAATKLGALYANADKNIYESLWNYGKCIGPAFQIRDDLLTLLGSYDQVGKEIGNDIKQGKKTLMVVHALKNSKEKERLLKILKKERDKTSKKDVKDAINIMKNSKSIEFAQEHANNLLSDAKRYLSVLPKSESQKMLYKITDFLVKRSY